MFFSVNSLFFEFVEYSTEKERKFILLPLLFFGSRECKKKGQKSWQNFLKKIQAQIFILKGNDFLRKNSINMLSTCLLIVCTIVQYNENTLNQAALNVDFIIKKQTKCHEDTFERTYRYNFIRNK